MKPESLNEEFSQRLREIVGEEEFDSILSTFSAPKRTGFRVNTIQSTVENALDELKTLGIDCTPVDWCSEAFTVCPEARSTLTHCELAESGAIYVQGLSSIFATSVLAPSPEQWNLDLASAPGGKASHMAALMGNQGKLSVVEPVKPRMYRLAANLKRLGFRFQNRI